MPEAAAPVVPAKEVVVTPPAEKEVQKEAPKPADKLRAAGAEFIAKRLAAQAEEERKARGEAPKEKPNTEKVEAKPNAIEVSIKAAKEEKGEVAKEKPDETEKPKEEPKGFKRTQAKPADPEAITKIATKAAVEAVRQTQPKAEPVKRRSSELQLPPEFEEQREVFELLAEKHPDKFGPKADKRIDEQLHEFVAKRQAYEKKWKSENPGQDFDLDSDDHAEFVEQNYPDIDPKDVSWAKQTSMERMVDRKADEKVAPLRKEMQVKETVQRLKPVAAKNADLVITNAVKAVDPEMAKFMTTDKLGELADANPSFDQALREVTPEFYGKTQAATMLLSPGGAVLYNDKDPLHQQVLEDALAIEDHILKSGNTVQELDGQELEYVPMREFFNLSEKDRTGKWTTDVAIVLGAYQGLFTEKLKQRYENLEQLVDKRVKSRSNGVAKIEQEKPVEKEEKRVEPQRKPASPVAASGAHTVGGGQGKATTMSGMQQKLFDAAFGRA